MVRTVDFQSTNESSILSGVTNIERTIMSNKKLYMIRNTETGLFSTGGSYPTFATKGKMWTTTGALTSHIKLVTKRYGLSRNFDTAEIFKSVYKLCEVVEVELTFDKNPALSVFEYIANKEAVKFNKQKRKRQKNATKSLSKTDKPKSN